MSPTQRSSDAAGWFIALVLCGAFGAAHPLAAQRAAQTDSLRDRPSIVLAAGLDSRSRLDQTASPVPYAGTGGDASLRVEIPSGSWRVRTVVVGGVQRMMPTTPTIESRERFIDAAWSADLLRSAVQNASRQVLVGLMSNTELSVTNHGYADPRATMETFLLGTAWLGPEAEWIEHVGGGLLSGSVGVPAVGLIEHPYADLKTAHPGVRLHGAAPATLRGSKAEVAFTSRAAGQYAVRYVYGLSSLGIRDVQPVHGMAQSFTVGVLRRFR